MDEETGAAPAKEDEATSASDGASCTTSAQTEIMKNSYIRNESDTTDAAKTVDLSTAEASTEEFSKKYSTEAASTVATPEPLHVLGQQAPSSPTSTASPSANSAAAEEVERLRREAEQIKAEQLKLEEEIRLAKLKKEELTKEVKFINTEEEEEDHIDIYCENPIDVMSAITEDHRTLMLKQDDHLEVMSQITEARTEARYFSDLQRRNKWMIGFAVILIVIVIAGVVGGVVSSNGNYGEDNPSGVEGEIGALNPTSSPIKSGPAIIDITDDDRPISEFPTLSPSYSVGTTASPSFNTIYASRVKIQSNNEAILNVFEVEIFDPAGVNVALGRNATQSSTFENFNASNAVDGVADTFSSTLKEVGAWWEVNLGGQLIPIQNMTIINYWCFDVSDQANCLARLSDSTLLLLDNDGTVLATRDIGDTTGIFELDFSFDTTIEASFPPVDSSPEVHNKIPTNMPSVGPIQTPAAPIPAPSSAPTADLSCPTGEGIFTVFFQFGADPSQISWAVVEECTNESIVVCDNCYQEYSPYSSADSHNCLSLDKTYTFIFEDAADDLWPSDSGFTISLNGDMDSKVGNGGSMPDTTIYFGDGLACPASSPTAKPTMVRMSITSKELNVIQVSSLYFLLQC